MSEIAKLIPDSVYPFRAERTIKGWSGSGFNRSCTEIKVRRVSVDGAEQAQFEIGIIEFKGKGERMYRHSGSLVLDAAQIDVLVGALQNIKVYS